MTQWKVKQLSDLTGVSVRMLHHYDEIGLLKPSVRTYNGYRLYSQENLATLQQIVALKFFGFGLSQIKTMLQHKIDMKEQLVVQQQALKEQVENLQQTQDALSAAIRQCDASKSLNWQNFVALIERSKMAQEIKTTWACKFSKDQKEFYIEIRRKHLKEVKAWEEAVDYINSEQAVDPEGAEGEKVVKAFLAFQDVSTRELKNNNHQNISEKQAKNIVASMLGKNSMSEKGRIWFVQAMSAYCNKILSHTKKA